MAELSAQPLARARGLSGKPGRGPRSRRKGEAQQATAAGLDLLRVLGWLVLHDADVPGEAEGAIDHVLAGPSGVYVVNTVSWPGAITMRGDVLSVGGTNRSEALGQVAAAADAVRAILGNVPVAPMLCFERLEAVTGVVGDVALCASENILDLLTSQPDLLSAAAFVQASRTITTACRPGAHPAARTEVVAPEPVPTQPVKKHNRKNTEHVAAAHPAPAVTPPQQPTEAVVASRVQDGPAAAVASAEDIARVAAFERLMTGGTRIEGVRSNRAAARIADPVVEPVVELVVDPVVDPVADPVVETVVDQAADLGVEPTVTDVATEDVTRGQSRSAIANAGAALWRQLTGSSDAEPHVDEVVDVDAALAEAEAWEREVEEAEAREREAREERERAERQAEEALAQERAERDALEAHERELEERAAQEARDRKARAAFERVQQEALELARQEAEEIAEREARARAEQEAREQAEREAAEAAAKVEQEAREQAEREAAEAAAKVEQEAREQAEREAAEAAAKVEQEAREQAEREAAEAAAKVEQEAREQAEREAAEAAAKVEQEAREQAEREAAEAAAKVEQEAREQAEQEAAEAKAKADQKAAAKAEQEAREVAEREAAEAKAQAEQEAREQAEREAAEAAAQAEQEAREVAEREAAEAKAQAEKDAKAAAQEAAAAKAKAEREARKQAEREAAEAKAQAEKDAKAAAREAAAAKAKAEQEAREQAEREAAAADESDEDEPDSEQLARERAAWEALKKAARDEREREQRENEEAWTRQLEVHESKMRVERERTAELYEALQPAAGRSAEPDPLAESKSEGRKPVGLRGFLSVALGAALIAVVIVAVPHASGAFGWAQQLFGKNPPTVVGTAVQVKATTAHPDVRVLAGTPVDAQPGAGVRVAKGEHLVAVPLRLENQGLTRWDVALASKARVVDTLGVARTVDRAVRSVKGLPLLGATVKVAPGNMVTGYVVFSVPNGRPLSSVALELGQAQDDAVTWKVTP